MKETKLGAPIFGNLAKKEGLIMDFTGFTQVIATTGNKTNPRWTKEPMMSINRYGVNFWHTTAKAIDNPPYINMFVNYTDKMLLIRPISEEQPNSLKFYKDDRTKLFYAIDGLTDRIVDLMGWNLDRFSYVVPGTYFRKENCVVFDFIDAKARPVIKRKSKKK